MKKTILLLVFVITLLLVGCTKKTEETKLREPKVICPTGAPAVAFYNHLNDETFETNSVPSNIVSFLNAESPYDIIVIDTVSGVKAISKGAPYKLYGTITFGNFYIASTGNDEDSTMDKDDTIVLFGQNQTPDLIFHYIYGSEYDESIEYVNAVADAAACLSTGENVASGSKVDYVFIAQPVLFATLNNKNAKTYGKSSVYANIQDLYKEKSNGLSLVQASIFVKNESDADIDGYLSSLQAEISSLIENPSRAVEILGGEDETLVKTKFGITANVMKATLGNNNSLGLGFKKAIENKDAINNFLKIFGVEEIDNDRIA